MLWKTWVGREVPNRITKLAEGRYKCWKLKPWQVATDAEKRKDIWVRELLPDPGFTINILGPHSIRVVSGFSARQ
jgi:hypothetical protein